MKKLLGISLVAVLAVSPLMAGAETANPSPIAVAESELASNGTNVVVAQKGAYYAGKQITDADRAATASAAYVKGAYNAAISAVNKVSEGLSGDLSSLDTRMDRAEENIGELSDRIGNIDSLSTEATNLSAAVNELNANKQDVISDLDTIRAGAAAGATAIQSADLATVATTGNASDLNQDASHRLVTDSEKSTWSGKQDALSQGSAISIQNNTVSVSGLTTNEIASGSMATSNTTGAVNNQLATKGYVDDVAASLNTLSQTDFVTKTEVTANINGATGAVTLDSNNGLAVAGNVSGTVPMMVEWGATTAQTAAVSGTISSGAKATGTIEGIDITAPTYVEDTPAG